MAGVNEFYLTDLQFTTDLVVNNKGDLADVSGLANLHQALLHRLITMRGALIHRPDYGVGVKNYQNAVGSIAVYRKLAAAIDEQFKRDFRVDEVTGVDVKQDGNNPGLFTIIVKVSTAGLRDVPLTFIPFGGS